MGKISNAERIQSRRQCRFAGDATARSRCTPECKLLKRSERHVDAPKGPRLFACPFAKHEPSAVPRSCFLGWQSIARLKEHLSRRHKPSSTEDPYRAGSTFYGFCSCGVSKCAGCKLEGLRLNEEASRMLRCRSPDCAETWTQLYCKIYSHATEIPSPFIDHSEPSQETRKHIIREFSEILCDGLDDVFRFTGRDLDTALARQLQDYILGQGQRYIEREQHEESESSGTDRAGSELASSERSLDSTNAEGPAPLLDPNVGNGQDSLVLSAPAPFLGDQSRLALSWHDFTKATEPSPTTIQLSCKSTALTAMRKRAQHAQSVSSWLDFRGVPPASSLSSVSEPFLEPELPDVIASEDPSPNSSVETIPQCSQIPMSLQPGPNEMTNNLVANEAIPSLSPWSPYQVRWKETETSYNPRAHEAWAAFYNDRFSDFVDPYFGFSHDLSRC